MAPFAREPGIGRQRIVARDLLDERLGQSIGQRRLALEMGVGIIGGEEQQLVRADMVEDAQDRRAIRHFHRLQGEAKPLAQDIGSGPTMSKLTCENLSAGG